MERAVLGGGQRGEHNQRCDGTNQNRHHSTAFYAPSREMLSNVELCRMFRIDLEHQDV
jgi:hypothetical protein